MYNVGFERVLFENVTAEQIADLSFASELYRAMCNVCWVEVSTPSERRGKAFWSCTWRTSGAIVADLRNDLLSHDTSHEAHESYLDYYCMGGEGEVSERIREFLHGLGWEPLSWDEIKALNGSE